jgi:hypothetical protein
MDWEIALGLALALVPLIAIVAVVWTRRGPRHPSRAGDVPRLRLGWALAGGIVFGPIAGLLFHNGYDAPWVEAIVASLAVAVLLQLPSGGRVMLAAAHIPIIHFITALIGALVSWVALLSLLLQGVY